MAITNAQQFKQLVNPPMEGKKRPGYRGDDAARSSEGTSAGRADPGGAGRGDTRGDPGPVERDTGLERARQRNIALDKQLLDTPFKGFNTPFASINFLGNTLGKFGYEKTTKFFSNNSIGGKINPATGEPFGYGPKGYNDYMNQRRIGNVNAFGNPTTQYDDQDDNDAYIFPRSGIMAEASKDMDQEPEIEEDEGLRLAFRANGGRIGFGGGSDMGTVADSQGNVGPGAGGYQGGGTDSVDRRGGGGGGPKGPPTNVGGGDKPKFDIFNPIDSIKAKLRNFAGLKPEDIAKIENEEDEDTNVIDTVFSEKPAADLQKVFGTGAQQRKDMYDKALGLADGGRIGLMEGGMPYEGGIMDLESARQMYGLGKLVKKVTRSVKKIAKSPIGKAALIGVAGFGIPGTSFGGLLGRASFGGAAPGIFGTFGPTSALKKLGIMKSEMIPGVLERTGPLSKLGIGSAIMGASALSGLLTPEQEDEAQALADSTGIDIEQARNSILAARRDDYKMDFRARGFRAEGGPAEGKEPVAKKTMPLLDMDGQEMDLRAEGGFVPIGRMEKADDVPARLSKNEFVFTADAVRNAGEGDVDKGAEVMYNMMKNLESGGEVSEESQGLEGARKMFQTSQRLEEVL